MIKRFTVKVLIQGLLVLILMELVSTAVLSSDNYFLERIPWKHLALPEIYSDGKIHSDTLILGGSVGSQLFRYGKKDNYFTTTAICLTTTGYFLANRIYKSNPQLKHIIFVCVPFGIVGGFEDRLTYNSFVRPFFTYRNLKYSDKYEYQKILQEPLAILSIFNTIKILPITNYNYSQHKINKPKFVADYSAHHLKRLKEFAAENNISISFVAPPLSESKRDTARWKRISAYINKIGLNELFEGYFENMVYLPDSCYVDKLHFKHSYLIKNRKKIVELLK